MPIPPVGWDGTLPIVISQPGSYVLTRNITATGASNGININVEHVYLDLNGFTLDGNDTGNIGISVNSGDVTIEHGSLRGWSGKASESGPYGGVRYRDLRLKGNVGGGFWLGGSDVVEDCISNNNNYPVVVKANVVGATIRNCDFVFNYGITIQMDSTATRALIEGNHIVVGGGNTGMLIGGRSTVRSNVIAGVGSYVSIDLNSSTNSVVYENRFDCGMASGNAADDFFLFDGTNARTNICHNP